MKIYYDSVTGNVKRFIEKLKYEKDFEIEKIKSDTIVTEDSHFITYTTGMGNVSVLTKKFLANKENFRRIKSVAVSGNRNWGINFGLAGDKIEYMYKIKLLMKFELSGTKKDVEEYINRVKELS